MSVASIVLKSGYTNIQYQPLPKEADISEEIESAVTPEGYSSDISTVLPGNNNEQQRLLTDEGEANVPLQTDDPVFNEIITEVCEY